MWPCGVRVTQELGLLFPHSLHAWLVAYGMKTSSRLPPCDSDEVLVCLHKDGKNTFVDYTCEHKMRGVCMWMVKIIMDYTSCVFNIIFDRNLPPLQQGAYEHTCT